MSAANALSPSAAFFATGLKAVVGASSDRTKFGNKVLRSYLEKNMAAVPVNKRSKVIEGVECVASLELLKAQVEAAGEREGGANVSSSMSDVGVSVITPPGVTRMILEEGYILGVRHFFLQPGTYDAEVNDYISSMMPGASVVKGCVLVELDYSYRD